MAVSRDQVVADLAAAFHAAAVGALSWETPIGHLAEATGSMTGELIGLGPQSVVPFNLMTNVAEGAAEHFVAAGGADPSINSRVRVGMRARELEVLDEAAFTTAADVRLNPAYGEWVRQHHMAHICLTTLLRDDGLLVGMALARNTRQGDIDAENKRIFAAVAPHVRRAVRTQMALEDQRLALVVGGLDALHAAVFLCDANRRVRAMTEAAENLVMRPGPLSVIGGRLTTRDARHLAALEARLGDVLAGGYGGLEPLALRGDAIQDGLLIEVAPAPGGEALVFGGCAMVIVQQPRADQQRLAAAARALYGLSASEAAIAAQLAVGQTAARIADQRQVSLGTVRSQVRSIFDKMSVSNQIQLAARLTLLR